MLVLSVGGQAAEDGRGALCDAYSGLPEGDRPHAGRVWIEGGTFTMATTTSARSSRRCSQGGLDVLSGTKPWQLLVTRSYRASTTGRRSD